MSESAAQRVMAAALARLFGTGMGATTAWGAAADRVLDLIAEQGYELRYVGPGGEPDA